MSMRTDRADESSAAPTQVGRPAGPGGWIVAVLAAAGILSSLTSTLVVPLLGEFPQILHAPASQTSWVVTITLLTAAVAMPILGRAADIFGKRRVLLFALAPLALGSALCALSTSLPLMIVGRGLQGFSSGLVPLGISLLHDVMPKEKVGGAIALMSSSLGIGGAIGLPVAAATIQFTSWRTLFWATGVCAVLVGILVVAIVPADRVHRSTGGFDVLGALLLAAALVCLLLGISYSRAWGYLSSATVGTLMAVVLLGIVWVTWEMRRKDPLIDVRSAAQPVVLLTNIATVLVGVALYSQSLLIPQLMQLPTATGYGLGQSMLHMGLWFAPSGVAMMAASPLATRLGTRFGSKMALASGCAVMAAGYGLAIPLTGSTWGLMTAAIVIGAGTGIAYAAMPALILGSVPATQKAAANGLNALMREVGTTLSAALISAVLAGMSVGFGSIEVPSLAGFRVGLAMGADASVLALAVALATPARTQAR